jgi:adenylyl cyclase-associated protein
MFILCVDSCRKTDLVVDTVVSSIEMVNCQSVQLQITGKSSAVTVDKTDGVQIFLSDSSLDVEIFTSKSSGVNVVIPGGPTDDYVRILLTMVEAECIHVCF